MLDSGSLKFRAQLVLAEFITRTAEILADRPTGLYDCERTEPERPMLESRSVGGTRFELENQLTTHGDYRR
jgi:hypothetical protein